MSTSIKAIVLDIDETLSPDISWITLTRELGASTEEHTRIYSEYREGVVGYQVARNALLDLWRATGNANKHYFQKVFQAIPLHQNAASIVNQLKQSYQLCLVTGSMDVYAQTVANKLDIECWYANTRLIWDRNSELVSIDYDLNQAAKKLRQFKGFCSEYSLKAQECVVVGDGENDLLMFDECGNGVLVGDAEDAWRMRARTAINGIEELPNLLAKWSK